MEFVDPTYGHPRGHHYNHHGPPRTGYETDVVYQGPLWLRHVFWFITLLIFFFFIFGMALMIIDQDTPIKLAQPLEFQVQSLSTPTLPSLSSSATATTTITARFNVTLWAANANYGALFEPAKLSIYYHHPNAKGKGAEYYLSSCSVSSFCPNRSCRPTDAAQSWVSATVNASSVPVSNDLTAFLMKQDIEAGEFGITVKIRAPDFRPLNETNRPSKLSVVCRNLRVGVPSGVLLDDPLACKVDWKRNWRNALFDD